MKFCFLFCLFIFLLFTPCASQDYEYYTPETEADSVEVTQPILKDTLTLDTLVADSLIMDTLSLDSIIEPIYATVTMNNLDVLNGELIRLDSSGILLRTSYSELMLDRKKIKGFETSFTRKAPELAEDTLDKKLFETPQAANYFFGPTAIPLEHRKLIYQNILAIGNRLEYGLTNNISIDLGVDLSSIFSSYTRMSTGLKAGFKLAKNVYASSGIRLATGPENRGADTFSLGYGLITLGDNENNITLGAGYGLKDGKFFDKTFLISSGVFRLKRGNLALMTENYYAPLGDNEWYYAGAFGLRAIFKRNSCLDIGFLYAEFIDSPGFIPMIGFSKKF